MDLAAWSHFSIIGNPIIGNQAPIITPQAPKLTSSPTAASNSGAWDTTAHQTPEGVRAEPVEVGTRE